MAKRGLSKSVGKVAQAVDDLPAPSPNPMTNVVLADIALRTGGQLMRQAVERSVLGVKYDKNKARAIVKGRSMTQTLVSTAIARLATRSIPGALLVGGGMLAKALYDRRKSRAESQSEGEAAVEEQAERAKSA